MKEKEFSLFSVKEHSYPDCSTLPLSYLLKSIFVKLMRRVTPASQGRFVWTVTAVNDVQGPEANVRNYIEHATVRAILSEISTIKTLQTAGEIGSGYGRMTPVLKEFAPQVYGFEREKHLVEIARKLLPAIHFICVDSLYGFETNDTFDFLMTCTVLQHMTDDDAKSVIEKMKKLVPSGWILLIEKNEEYRTSSNQSQGDIFLSRARSVETYTEWMKPFELVNVRNRILEPTYDNPSPGSCMLYSLVKNK